VGRAAVVRDAEGVRAGVEVGRVELDLEVAEGDLDDRAAARRGRLVARPLLAAAGREEDDGESDEEATIHRLSIRSAPTGGLSPANRARVCAEQRVSR
jgi:hypothetical protein